jgi:hypothetical protein
MSGLAFKKAREFRVQRDEVSNFQTIEGWDDRVAHRQAWTEIRPVGEK